MSILQSFGIALATALMGASYLIVCFKVSDWVHKRFGSMDLGALAFVVMIVVPVLTALFFVLSNIGTWP